MSAARAVRSFRMGISPIIGMAVGKKELARTISVDLLSGKQEDADMGRNKNPHAQALGSLGGKARAKNLSDAEIARIASKGGKARATKLSAAERRRIAMLGVAARLKARKERT